MLQQVKFMLVTPKSKISLSFGRVLRGKKVENAMNETALISEVLRLQDGRSQIKTIGTRRFEAGFGISRVPTLARESRFCAFWEEHVVS